MVLAYLFDFCTFLCNTSHFFLLFICIDGPHWRELDWKLIIPGITTIFYSLLTFLCPSHIFTLWWRCAAFPHSCGPRLESNPFGSFDVFCGGPPQSPGSLWVLGALPGTWSCEWFWRWRGGPCETWTSSFLKQDRSTENFFPCFE